MCIHFSLNCVSTHQQKINMFVRYDSPCSLYMFAYMHMYMFLFFSITNSCMDSDGDLKRTCLYYSIMICVSHTEGIDKQNALLAFSAFVLFHFYSTVNEIKASQPSINPF